MSEIALVGPHCLHGSVSEAMEKRPITLVHAQTDNVHRPRRASVSRYVPGALTLNARNGPIVGGQSLLACGEDECEVERR